MVLSPIHKTCMYEPAAWFLISPVHTCEVSTSIEIINSHINKGKYVRSPFQALNTRAFKHWIHRFLRTVTPKTLSGVLWTHKVQQSSPTRKQFAFKPNSCFSCRRPSLNFRVLRKVSRATVQRYFQGRSRTKEHNLGFSSPWKTKIKSTSLKERTSPDQVCDDVEQATSVSLCLYFVFYIYYACAYVYRSSARQAH